jgi:S-adenosylmethionine decarboxylase
MEAFGRHFILEMWDCNREIVNDVKKITQILSEAVNDAGATIIKQFYHEFNPPGITGVAILTESHISIHTWPEEGYVAVDLFTCGTQTDPKLAEKRFLEGFEPKDFTSVELKRGSPLIKGTLLSEAYSELPIQ